MTVAERLFCAPIAGLVPVSEGEANQLLVRWGHDLGPCERPFGSEAWVLDIDGRAVSVAISASTVSANIPCPLLDRTYERGQVVELARLCSDPAERWATRPMLRLWREIAAPRWSYWPVLAAVSYSTSRHTGDLYRWDGWRLGNEHTGISRGGGTWSKRRPADHEAAGPKRLWIWDYAAPHPQDRRIPGGEVCGLANRACGEGEVGDADRAVSA
jgi:hypothetical protein